MNEIVYLNMESDLNRHLSKEYIWMTNKHVKRCSASLIIKEMQVKTTVMFHFLSTMMSIVKKTENNKCWQECGEIRAIILCYLEYKMSQPLCKTVSWFLTTLNIVTRRLSISTTKYRPRRNEDIYYINAAHKCSQKHYLLFIVSEKRK